MQLIHYAQEIKSNKFRQYDLGLLGNLKKYGQISPPNYNIKKIVAPVALYYASNDDLSAVKVFYIVSNFYDGFLKDIYNAGCGKTGW